MRGVLKVHKELPHLSGVGDVRTASVHVQAAYRCSGENPSEGEPPEESGAALSMSPTTGSQVSRVTDMFLTSLLRRHQDEIVYLGKAFRMEDVKLPLTIRHFGDVGRGGAGEAYHSGIFGITGSGKSVFAAYLLAAQLRHPDLAVIVIDPQGQFTRQHDMPVPLDDYAREQGRTVKKYSISQDLKLPKDAPFLTDLLGGTRFFRDILSIGAQPNRDSAREEISVILRDIGDWDRRTSDDLLRTILARLGDEQVLTRIYSAKQSRDRLRGRIEMMLESQAEFELASALFVPLHSLFTNQNQDGGSRQSIYRALEDALRSSQDQQPRAFTIIDFSSSAGSVDDILEQTPVKARILRIVCRILNQRAEQLYQSGESLNTVIVFDEAQRFVANDPEDDESRELADKIVDYVRTTRKYGLGWTFITQEVGSLRRGVYNQLRVRAFGYGLTSGTERERLRETIGDQSALDVYRSFVDPQASVPREYPFMLSGPVSPLSFTGTPVFLSVFTSFEDFKAANAS